MNVEDLAAAQRAEIGRECGLGMPRESLGVAQINKPAGLVAESIERLDRTIIENSELIRSLADRLQIVLRPATPETKEAVIEKEIPVPVVLAEAITGISRRVNESVCILHDILQRLEL